MHLYKHLLITLWLGTVAAHAENTFNISIASNHAEENIHWKDVRDFTINVTCLDVTPGAYVIKIVSQDVKVATIEEPFDNEILCTGVEEDVITRLVTLRGQFLGRTNLSVTVGFEGGLEDDGKNGSLMHVDHEIVVVNHETALNIIFIVVVALLIVIINFGFGCKIDLKVVKSILVKPIPPLIGMGCQFLVMPLLGCALTYLFSMEKSLGFGVLVTASAPGGGGSNIWTYMLGGDLDLSITMTLCSKALALVMMPLWMFALGRLYVEGTRISIPYSNIIYGLLSIVVPCFLGVLLNKYKPAVAQKVCIAIRPLSCLFIFWVIIVGSITNPYVYNLMGKVWYVIPAGVLLPYLGMLLGYAIARLAKQGNRRSITIAIETGIQDTGIAIILLLSSFAKPDGDLAATLPITSAMFTPFPLLIALIAQTVRDKCWRAGKCVRCGGPENILITDRDPEEDDVSNANTKVSELSPREEKDGNLSNNGGGDHSVHNGTIKTAGQNGNVDKNYV